MNTLNVACTPTVLTTRLLVASTNAIALRAQEVLDEGGVAYMSDFDTEVVSSGSDDDESVATAAADDFDLVSEIYDVAIAFLMTHHY